MGGKKEESMVSAVIIVILMSVLFRGGSVVLVSSVAGYQPMTVRAICKIMKELTLSMLKPLYVFCESCLFLCCVRVWVHTA